MKSTFNVQETLCKQLIIRIVLKEERGKGSSVCSINRAWRGVLCFISKRKIECFVIKKSARCMVSKLFGGKLFVCELRFFFNSKLLRKQSPEGIYKICVLENVENFTENTCVGVSFWLSCRLRLLEKWLWHTCFPVNFAKFFTDKKVTFFTDHFRVTTSSFHFQLFYRSLPDHFQLLLFDSFRDMLRVSHNKMGEANKCCFAECVLLKSTKKHEQHW